MYIRLLCFIQHVFKAFSTQMKEIQIEQQSCGLQ